jgi:hypothetical protein
MKLYEYHHNLSRVLSCVTFLQRYRCPGIPIFLPFEVVTFCNLVVLTLLLDGRSNWPLVLRIRFGMWGDREKQHSSHTCPV